jgi:hypothetical protein
VVLVFATLSFIMKWLTWSTLFLQSLGPMGRFVAGLKLGNTLGSRSLYARVKLRQLLRASVGSRIREWGDSDERSFASVEVLALAKVPAYWWGTPKVVLVN